jgi:hypothetical protein
MPNMVVEPTFICELCQVRAILGRDLHLEARDIQLLGLKRMRMIDCRNSWQQGTLSKYGGHLRYLQAFECQYQCSILTSTQMAAPPVTPAIPLQWAQLGFSLRQNRAGERVKFGTVCQLRSAANMFYMVDSQLAYPHQTMKSKSHVSFQSHVTPPDSAMLTFATKGMERRLGSHSKPSWALLHVHIKWIDDCLHEAWQNAPTTSDCHNLAIAGFANLMFYLGWLRGGELFDALLRIWLLRPRKRLLLGVFRQALVFLSCLFSRRQSLIPPRLPMWLLLSALCRVSIWANGHAVWLRMTLSFQVHSFRLLAILYGPVASSARSMSGPYWKP